MQAESSSGTDVNGHSGGNNSKATHVPVSHSRNSSDSSGYHEASVLSESPAEGNQMSEKYDIAYVLYIWKIPLTLLQCVHFNFLQLISLDSSVSIVTNLWLDTQ